MLPAFESLVTLLAEVPWVSVGIATVVGYILGMAWYTVLFGKAWMRLSGRPEEEGTNKPAMVVQFVTTFVLAYTIGLIFLVTDVNLAWLLVDGFVGTLLLVILATKLFNMTNNRKAMKLWLIEGGYYVVLILLTAAIIHFGI